MNCLLPDKTRLTLGSDVQAEQVIHAIVYDGRALAGDLVPDIALGLVTVAITEYYHMPRLDQ